MNEERGYWEQANGGNRYDSEVGGMKPVERQEKQGSKKVEMATDEADQNERKRKRIERPRETEPRRAQVGDERMSQ